MVQRPHGDAATRRKTLLVEDSPESLELVVPSVEPFHRYEVGLFGVCPFSQLIQANEVPPLALVKRCLGCGAGSFADELLRDPQPV